MSLSEGVCECGGASKILSHSFDSQGTERERREVSAIPNGLHITNEQGTKSSRNQKQEKAWERVKGWWLL